MVLQTAPTQVRPLIDRLNEALDELENSAAESVFSLRLDKDAILNAKAKIIALYPRPIVPAAHGERLSVMDQGLVGRALSDYAANSLADGYGTSLTVREVERLIAAAKTEALDEAALLCERHVETIGRGNVRSLEEVHEEHTGQHAGQTYSAAIRRLMPEGRSKK